MEEKVAVEQDSQTNLKSLYSQMMEIHEILRGPEDTLDIVVNGDHPVEGNALKEQEKGRVTLDTLSALLHNISKRSSGIAKLTNRLAGN